MRTLSAVLFFLIFQISGHTQKIERIDGSLITCAELTAKVSQLMRDANVSGVALSVYNNNQPVYSETFGYADLKNKTLLSSDSHMYACSFAKTVFAFIAMQFVEEKVLDLDKPLVEYLDRDLPEYKIPGWRRGYQDLAGDDRYKKITARMCLTHTTGFPNWRWFEPDKKLRFKFSPQQRYAYSGEGMYLLQFVLEQITGKDYETICKERVFSPLAMHSTSMVWQDRFDTNLCYGHNNQGEPYEIMKWKDAGCSGTMTTTPNDFNKFFTALVNHRHMSKKMFNLMTITQVKIKSRQQFGPLSLIDSTGNDKIELGYGLGVGVFKTPYGKAFFKEGHDDGWGHYSIAFPDKKIAFVVMTNNDNGESIFKELLAFAIADVYTPWQWENYIPYNQK